jgi:hypothetical protein
LCGDAEQTTDQILQDCKTLQSLRDEMWTVQAKTTHKKLYGPVEDLKRTTTFITRAALCNQAIDKKKREPYQSLERRLQAS